MDTFHYRSSAGGVLAREPSGFIDLDYGTGFELCGRELEYAQLSALRMRLEQLRPRVAALDALATEHGIRSISRLEDVVPLLFAHTAYKSYPLSWLEEARFDRLTSWLGRFTAKQLPRVHRGQFAMADDWIEFLDANSEVRVVHTFGTSGKLSFIPRSTDEWTRGAELIANCIRDLSGPGAGVDLRKQSLPIVQPSYQYGASAGVRGVEMLVNRLSSHEALFLYPGERFSADVASLAGRLRAADARGDGRFVSVPQRVIARRERFADRERRRPQRVREFLAEMLDRYRGRDVVLLGVWPVLSDWAEQAFQLGISNVFGPGSVLITGGGTKGRNLPQGWRQRIFEFLGFERHLESYTMTELIAGCPRCELGRYHVPPVLIPFVLDPVTGAPFERTQRATGRFAFVDLLADSTWTGLVTGDEVTLSGESERCDCGRSGSYIEPEIHRYESAQGGDDKITCGGVDQAHAQALEFLAS